MTCLIISTKQLLHDERAPEAGARVGRGPAAPTGPLSPAPEILGHECRVSSALLSGL